MALPSFGSILNQVGTDVVLGKSLEQAFTNTATSVLSGFAQQGLNKVESLLSGQSNGSQGWMPKAQARPDPLLEIDWVPFFPLGLPDEYVESMQFSHPRINSSTGIFRNGSHIYMVENIDNTPMTATFYEDRLMTVTQWLYRWRSLISPDNKHFNYQSIYKKNIRAFAKDVKGNTVGQFYLYGCFPTTFPQVSFVSEGSPRVQLSVEFSVDRTLFSSPGQVSARSFSNLLGSTLGADASTALGGGLLGGLANSIVSGLSTRAVNGVNIKF